MSFELQKDKSKWLTGITQTENEKYSKGWTEKRVQTLLYHKYNDKSRFLARNKYVFDGNWKGTWESDFFNMTHSGITAEYEIKVHSTDVRKEVTVKGKKHEFLRMVWETKGECLRNPNYDPEKKGSKEFLNTCPNKFVFVCQAGLIDPDYVRENYPYAGLLWIMNDGKIRTKVRAPKLHPIKIDLSETLLYKFYYHSNFLDYTLYMSYKKYLDNKDKFGGYGKKFMEDMFKELKIRYV